MKHLTIIFVVLSEQQVDNYETTLFSLWFGSVLVGVVSMVFFRVLSSKYSVKSLFGLLFLLGLLSFVATFAFMAEIASVFGNHISFVFAVIAVFMAMGTFLLVPMAQSTLTKNKKRIRTAVNVCTYFYFGCMLLSAVSAHF